MRRGSTVKIAALTTVLALAGGCAGTPPTPQPVPVSHEPTTQVDPGPARSYAGEAIALSARELPKKYLLDGSITEWGVEPNRNVVAIGVDATRLVLAIGWAGAKPPSLSIAIATPVPMIPDIGWSQRGGTTHELTRETCQFEQIPLIEAGWDDGRPQPPEVAKACLDILARYEKQSLEYRERFIRRLRIDDQGVALVDAAGVATPIPGASMKSPAPVFGKEAREPSLEVELPLTALPDLAQAPLAYLFSAAAFGPPTDAMQTPPEAPYPGSDEPPKPSPGWTRLELSTPVAFGGHPDILASVFKDASGVLNGGVMSEISYAPATPDTITMISVPDVMVAPSKVKPTQPGAIGGPTGPDRPALLLSNEALLETLETHGKLTIARARGSIITLLDGKLVAESYLSRPDAIQQRGEELHLFQYDEGGPNYVYGYQPPAWQAAAVKPDGTIAEIAEEGPDFPGAWDAWDGIPKSFHNADWTSFGIRGKRHGKPRSATWQWDAATKHYVLTVVPPNTP